MTKGTLGSCREAAQRFTSWCTAQGRFRPDPMEALKPKTMSQLHAEINQLRAAVFSMRHELDQARQQLRNQGAR